MKRKYKLLCWKHSVIHGTALGLNLAAVVNCLTPATPCHLRLSMSSPSKRLIFPDWAVCTILLVPRAPARPGSGHFCREISSAAWSLVSVQPVRCNYDWDLCVLRLWPPTGFVVRLALHSACCGIPMLWAVLNVLLGPDCPCVMSVVWLSVRAQPPPLPNMISGQLRQKQLSFCGVFSFFFFFFFCKNFLQQKFFFTFEFQTIVNTQICFCPFSFLFFGTSSPNWFSAKLWMIQGATNAQCYQAFKFEYGIPRFEPRYMDPVLREWQGGLRFPDWTGGSSLKSGQRVSMSSIWLELCSGHQTKVEVTPLVPSLLS